jgi:hypothetical protein
VPALECKCYLCGEYHKRSNSYEIAKLKGIYIYIYIYIYINKDHHQLNANFIASVISTLVINILSMTVATIRDEIKLN